jgi:hypothetical protein
MDPDTALPRTRLPVPLIAPPSHSNSVGTLRVPGPVRRPPLEILSLGLVTIVGGLTPMVSVPPATLRQWALVTGTSSV